LFSEFLFQKRIIQCNSISLFSTTTAAFLFSFHPESLFQSGFASSQRRRGEGEESRMSG
jgi:hypothetical protein